MKKGVDRVGMSSSGLAHPNSPYVSTWRVPIININHFWNQPTETPWNPTKVKPIEILQTDRVEYNI